MYIVTNRTVDESKQGLNKFGSTPNSKGPNELRLVQVLARGTGFEVNLKEDELDLERIRELSETYNLSLDDDKKWYASLEVACELFTQACKSKKDLLLYVHGYNNDIEDVVKTMQSLEELYPVIVIGFSWPANGGGPVSGTSAYLSDKRDARASSDALNRLVDKIHYYHYLLSEDLRDRLQKKSSKVHKNNYQAAQEYYSELLAKACKTRLNLLCHSMGNYLLKYALMPSDGGTRKLVFDNVSLVAADANNKDHKLWLECISPRNRVYIVLNEDDFALKWSRRKPGEEQLARLGHYRKQLNASNVSYIDVSNTAHVGKSHSYFIGKPVKNNEKLRTTFSEIFSGGRVERGLKFHSDENVYEV